MAANQVVVLAILAIVLPTFAMATDYIVGDAKGWTINLNYDDWAKDKVFWVGDRLIFHYNTTLHDVFKVNGTAFTDCVVPPSNEALRTGNDTITLASPGKKWYICGTPNHCAKFNQKLRITVLAEGAPAPTPIMPTTPAPSAANGLMKSAYPVVMAAVGTAAMILV